ncbi:MAG: hypothetical protein K2M78_15525 [Lachnospiraceae bacterium]|nr:hypothetical protein [Lachnospiraceae bacterium]
MMDYDMFKAVVEQEFKKFLPEEYQKMKMKIEPVKKVNCTLDGIRLVGIDGNKNVFPTIYINDMYKHYSECDDYREAIKEGAMEMAYLLDSFSEVEKIGIDFTDAKENIVFQLVNTEQNREMLQGMPHREMEDLSIIYRWVINTKWEGIQSSMVNNNLAEKLGLNEEQLYNLAVENTRRIFPPCIESMDDIIRKMFSNEGMQEDMIEMIVQDKQSEKGMWVITNDTKLFGATTILYEDKLHELAEQLGSNLYILPSSIHEVIAISAEIGSPDELAVMVEDVNMTEVSIEERLSNQVYHYDKDLRKLSLATNTPNKSLDGVVSEPAAIYETKQSR